MKRILLLVNPLFDQRPDRHRDLVQVIKALQAAGVDVTALETLPNHVISPRVQEVLESEPDAVLVCGGDGTIFDTVQSLVGTEIPLGVVPFGTGNILAQNLKLPRKPLAAVEMLLNAKLRRVPLGRLTCGPTAEQQSTWYFTVAAGLGLHASLMSASKTWGKRIGGQAAYYAAGMDILLRHHIQPFHAEMTTVDGQVYHRDCCEAIAVRVAELNRWRPRGSLDRPWLRLVTVGGTSRGALARATWDAIATPARERQDIPPEGDAPSYLNVVRAVFRPIEGHAYRSPVQIEADGEVLGVSTATMEMSDQTLMLLSPERAGAEDTSEALTADRVETS